MSQFQQFCNEYLDARTGNYNWRSIRYKRAVMAMSHLGLNNDSVVFDVGAGRTEFDHTLRTMADFKGTYVPVDGAIDGTQLDLWVPPRDADFFVALEILEHLHQPMRLVGEMMMRCKKAIIVSTPNPRTTDVLGMDMTHLTPITGEMLYAAGFLVNEDSFYGKDADSLFGIWMPSP